MNLDYTIKVTVDVNVADVYYQTSEVLWAISKELHQAGQHLAEIGDKEREKKEEHDRRASSAVCE